MFDALRIARHAAFLVAFGAIAAFAATGVACAPAPAPAAEERGFAGAEEAFPGRSGQARAATVMTADGERTLTYQLVDGTPIVDGDILLPDEPDRTSGTPRAAAILGRRWPGGRVPYEIDPDLPDPERVHDAIAHYHDVTRIRLVPRSDELDYVRFVPGEGCSSQIGRVGGAQDIALAALCLEGQVVHEIGHALGLWHEHARRDRDDFVVIHRGNIAPGKESNFDKYASGEELGRYDDESIMHYGSFAFSRDPERPTMTRRDGTLIGANRSVLSDGDRAALARLYGDESAGSPAYRDHLSGDWNGDGIDDVGIRDGDRALLDVDFDSRADLEVSFDDIEEDDQLLAGDWDGDGRDDLAVRRGSRVLMDLDLDGESDREQDFGEPGDEYLVGDWDRDGRDSLAVRRGDLILMDIDFDSRADLQQRIGAGDDDEYLVGDWEGDGYDTIAVRRGDRVLMDANYDARFDFEQRFGNGDDDAQYLVGDWDADGRDNLAVRRGPLILMDFDFDARHESEQPCIDRDSRGARLDVSFHLAPAMHQTTSRGHRPMTTETTPR
jgi:hypothetical protein